MRLISICPICGIKNVQAKKISKFGSSNFITLECGHTYVEAGIKEVAFESLILEDGRILHPFQNEGVKFIERSNFRCQISDEMGLGKTIQAIGAINLHYDELKPILIIVKASLTFNWLREIVKGSRKIAQIFESGDKILPGIGIVIVSYDTLVPRKVRGSEWEVNENNFKTLRDFHAKTIILDEVQAIKNHNAKRTQAIRELVRSNGTKHIISLSGTPIKNNALEYFPILNLLHPELFPTLESFERNWVDYYWNGTTNKPGGIKNPDEFLALTKNFIIRRTRDEVMPELPKILRDFKYYKMGEIVRKEYGKKVKKLDEFLEENENQSGNEFYTNLMAYLSILRHITGLSKIEPAIEYINEFIENGGKKIVIFHHHIDAGDILTRKLSEFGIPCIRMTAADNAETRSDKIEQFRTGEEIVLIAPTLACGEGINLQFCSNAILLEREWNPANEEQVEGRFSRIGSVAGTIDVCYPTAVETIDEYFAEIVERKRAIVDQSLDGRISDWNESEVMLELANLVVKKWKF
jgi:SWI/SNF-related matrix-associated actin-dependent regulator of chromatin subfamily A-like protein 1